jgi:signal transduction histidine kinase
MVVVAFLVPLFILVSDLARDSALSQAERDAESLARVLSVLTVESTVDEAIQAIGEDRISDVDGSVILSDGTVVGIPIPDDEDLSLAESGSSFLAETDGGIAVYVPVLITDGSTTVVRVFVPDAEMRQGVRRSWLVLTALGITLVVIAAWVADRLGRSMVEPVNQLALTANRLGSGDLDARVQPSGPPEVEEVGIELNRLASQIGRLLQQERETVADLAHRLRTPLTAARLSVEGLPPGEQKRRLEADIDDLQRTTDFIISDARRPVRRGENQSADLSAIVRDRVNFWSALASDEDRQMTATIPDGPAWVSVPTVDLRTVVDALLENVLSHTPDGTPFTVVVERGPKIVTLSVEDAGPGFRDGRAIERGESTGDSTGLGLDIVRRTIEDSGGSLFVGESIALGGAAIIVQLATSDPPRK